MNGWYLHNKEDWPPSTHIHPLFVSVHFNVSAYDTLLSDLSISYLKKNINRLYVLYITTEMLFLLISNRIVYRVNIHNCCCFRSSEKVDLDKDL